MSRKDTIITAVLINAGLLIVLFASALKSGGSDDALVVNKEPLIEEVPAMVAKKETPVIVGDEVDRALQQFASQRATPPVLEEIPVSAAALQGESNPFIDDLKTIATPQNPTVQTLVAPLVTKEQNRLPEFTQVTVKKGDVLEKIARHHHSSVAEIMKANHLTSSNLRIGQVLKVPHKTGSLGGSASAVSANIPNEQSTMYTVKKGDNPWTIAVKNQMKVEDLLKLNNLNEAQAKRLKPGDQLRIQ